MEFKTVKDLHEEIKQLRKQLNIIERELPELRKQEVKEAISEIQSWKFNYNVSNNDYFVLVAKTSKNLELDNYYFENVSVNVNAFDCEPDELEIVISCDNIYDINNMFKIKNIIIDDTERLYLENTVKNITYLFTLGE